jgi:hypothetical protein
VSKKLSAPFEDTVLPLFEQPDLPVEPERTKKQQDDDENKLQYRRYRGAKRVLCEPCTSAQQAGEQPGINDASYVRQHGREEQWLCFRHKQEREHRDKLHGAG